VSATRYRPDIDGLRAVAVVLVILFHLDLSWLPGGFVGVDVFFVLSGYLITSLIAREIGEGRFSFLVFYERRFRRIYPSLLVMLVASAAVGWVISVPAVYKLYGRTEVWAVLSGSNFAFMGNEGYFDPGNLSRPLLHTWSLGVEEQFYLVFPGVLILARRWRFGFVRTVAAMSFASLGLSAAGALLEWNAAYFLLPTRFWELGIGALIAVAPRPTLKAGQASLLGGAGLVLIAASGLLITESARFPGVIALAPTLGAAALILSEGGLANRLLALSPFALIGRLSYALYLWHWPLIAYASAIDLAPSAPTTRVLVVGLSLALSVAGYYLFETPIRARRMLAGRRAFFAALAAMSLALVIHGILAYNTNGLPQRLPAALARAYMTAMDDSRLVSKRCPDLRRTDTATCVIGDEKAEKTSFIVVGDSHSEAVAVEIGDVAARHGLKGLFLGHSGCQNFPEIHTPGYAICPARTRLAFDTYDRIKPPLVIYIVRWSAVVGDPYGGAAKVIEGRNGPIAEADRFETIAGELDKVLTAFSASRVVTTLTVPEHPVDVPSAVVWQQGIGRRFGPSMPDLTLDAYRRSESDVARLLAAAKTAHSNFDVLDPAPVFCPAGTCLRTRDGAILYRDSNHLTHAGAQLLAPMFEPYFAALGKGGHG
jgi:peptidoglycan/LPS O-acetylase OafA/YrhL